MHGFSRLSVFFLAMALLVTATPAAWAREMVAAKVEELNMRSGPGTRYEATWTVARGYPFQVIKRKGNWLQVRDFENDRAWVYRPMTNKTPHRVVKSNVLNLRRSPSTSAAVVMKAGYGDVLRTLAQRGTWTKVRHQGGTVGWVATRLSWGW